MDILIKKWNNFFNITPMRFIQLHERLSTDLWFQIKILHSDPSRFDYKLEEFAICPNMLNMDILIRKWNNFFNITPMRFI